MKKKVILAVLSLIVGMNVIGCDSHQISSSKPSTSFSTTSENSEINKTDFIVKFWYGLNHDKVLSKTSYGGAKVSLTNSQISSFAVKGYKITGYSTDAWRSNGISSDLDVYVQYAPLNKYIVQYLNPDDSLIKEVSVIEGESVEESEIPTARDVKATKGYYFYAWDNISASYNVESNVKIKAIEKKANGVIPKVDSINIDGQKDQGYEFVGTLVKQMSNKPVENWEKDGRGLDARLYACWDGDYIYYFVEVDDPNVVTFGKDYYEKVENCWKSDKVELWFNINDTYQKASLDAFGYFTHGNNFSDYMNKNKLYATSLVGDALDNYKDNVNPIKTTATGYNVEMAIPAYVPMSTDFEECEKMLTNDHLCLTLQLNSADDIDSKMIEEAISFNDLNKISGDKVNQCWTGKQCSTAAALTEEDKIWTMILG